MWSKFFLFCALLILCASIIPVRSDDTPDVNSGVDGNTAVATHTTSTDTATKEEEAMSYDGLNAAELATLEAKSETHEFQAEVNRLMDIIINSLYSKREIFVREIISNSADALDKFRYLALTNATGTDAANAPKDLDIHIQFDKDKKTLTFTDTGVGMTKEDLIRNLGVVAKSGTSEFVEAATKGSESDALSLIGQFGVGFYSVYLVADEVTVISKNANDKQHIWKSKADRTFTVVEDPRGDTLGRGTQVILKMKSDAEDFLNEGELKKIVSRYSEFVNYPIYLWVSKTVEKEVVDEEAMKKDAEEKEAKAKEKAEKLAAGEEIKEEEELEVSEEEEGGDKKPKMKKEYIQVPEWEQINSVKAIWTRNPKDVTEEEYAAFYKTLTKDDNGPTQHIHFKAEGEITFRSILFVPKKAPAAMYDKFYEKSTALKLYVRRVMISDEFEDFLPRYLNFIRGVVDSDDLPLNVSRETLAQSRVLRVMAKKITRKVLEMLKKMADASRKLQNKDKEEGEEKTDESEEKRDKKDEEDVYHTFWKNFGKSIKLGVIDDRSNKPKLAKLLRFQTTKSEGKLIGLEDYVDRMKTDQKYIYYITGENMDAVKSSPFLETLKKKDFEVLFMTDPLDEYLVQSLTEFDGTQLQSITKEGLKLGDEDKIKAQKAYYKDLLDWLQKTYGDKVERVTISNRIAESPCVLVTSQYGWSANMERIMKAQTFSNPEESQYMFAKKTMEINPRHPIIKEMKNKIANDPSDKQLVDLANLLYDSALLTSGFSLKDTADFASRIQRVIAGGLNVDPTATIDENEDFGVPEENKASDDNSASDSSSTSENAEQHAEPAGHDEL